MEPTKQKYQHIDKSNGHDSLHYQRRVLTIKMDDIIIIVPVCWLGLWIYSRLDFKHHQTQRYNKAKWAFSNIKSKFDQSMEVRAEWAETMCSSIIIPKLIYGLELWGDICSAKIRTFYNDIARWLSGQYTAPLDLIFAMIHWPSWEDLITCRFSQYWSRLLSVPSSVSLYNDIDRIYNHWTQDRNWNDSPRRANTDQKEQTLDSMISIHVTDELYWTNATEDNDSKHDDE
eukprot:479544_1